MWFFNKKKPVETSFDKHSQYRCLEGKARSVLIDKLNIPEKLWEFHGESEKSVLREYHVSVLHDTKTCPPPDLGEKLGLMLVDKIRDGMSDGDTFQFAHYPAVVLSDVQVNLFCILKINKRK